MMGSVIFGLLNYFLKQQELFNDTVFRMRDQLQRHFVMTFGTDQRVFSEAVKESLLKRFGRQYTVAVGVFRQIGREDIGQLFSHLLIPYISVKAVISDSVKSLRQNMLNHPSDKCQGGQCFVFNLAGFMVSIPVSDRLAVIALDSANRDGGRYHVFGQVPSQSLSAGRDLAGLKEGDKSFGVIFPGMINLFFNGRIGADFSEHRQQMVLPLFVHQFVWNIRDRFPLTAWVDTSCGHQDMQMGVVMAGASGGLKYDDVSDVQIHSGCAIEDIVEAGVSGPHEGAEPFGVTKEPEPKRFRHGQYDMSIGHPGQQASADEIRPPVGVPLGTGQAEAGFAGKGDASYLAAVAASELDKSHLFGIAAVEHFLYGIVIIGTVKFGMGLLERLPVIVENLLESVFVKTFHGCSLQTTIP